MMLAIRAAALRKGVRVVNRVMATDLLTSDGLHPTGGRVVGAIGIHTRTAEPWLFRAKATVVATGPYLYPYAPSGKGFYGMPVNSSADGIAMMFRAGATLGKMEFGGGSLRPLEFYCAPALEMLGGLGCRFVNDKGEDLLSMGGKKGKYSHETSMRGRRSALSNAIVKEMKAGHRVYLDATHFTPEQHRLVKQVVPIVVSNFERGGYDLSKDRIPYCSTFATSSGTSGGGARINERGETSVPGLYAAGNCSDGAYICLGQTLYICGLTGWWAGEATASFVRQEMAPVESSREQIAQHGRRYFAPHEVQKPVAYEEVRDKVTDIQLGLAPTLNAEKLGRALDRLESVIEEDLPRLGATEPRQLARVNGLKLSLPIMKLILRIMEHRKESRGNIIREDYPHTDNDHWLVHTVVQRLSERESRLWNIPVPEEWWIFRPPKGKFLHPYFQGERP